MSQRQRFVGLTLGSAILVSLVALASHEWRQAPPPPMWWQGLPVQGDWADARRAGFLHCIRISLTVRCRKEGVMVVGQGPFSGALDLRHSDGSGGFLQLTVWHPDEQAKGVYAVGPALQAQGWALCRTGPTEFRGDQEIYTKSGEKVRFSIDISYWGKRRLRVLPELNQPIGHCWSR